MKKLFALVATASLMFSCSQEVTPDLEKFPINMSVGQQTRATDTTFDSGDEVGIYVVNYDGSTAGSLKATGNQVDNMRFTYRNSAWTPDETIYWKDKTTAADFYAYYPYSASPNISAHPFAVAADQSAEEDFWSSDFLWGKTANVSPTSSAVPIVTNHSLSRILVDVVPGDGFAGEWGNAAVSVKICDVKTSATIDLATGVATATGEKDEIAPLAAAETGTTLSYKAMMIPQVVADNSKLVVVTVDGVDYIYRKGYEFRANTEHKFTVTVNKTGGSVKMSIAEWTIDDTINNGRAEVESESEASIPNNQIWYTATKKVEPNASANFGATIVSNEWDSTTGKGVITFDGDVTTIGQSAFQEYYELIEITIPDSVTEIGMYAFTGTYLSAITIPDSVTEIGECAFAGTSLLSITIPDSVTKMGHGILRSSQKLTSVTIGSGLTQIEDDAFNGCRSLKTVNISNRATTIGNSVFSSCESLESVNLPNSITSIGVHAFTNSGLTEFTFPVSLQEIGEGAFSDCTNLKTVTSNITDHSLNVVLAENSFDCSGLGLDYLERVEGSNASSDNLCLIINGVIHAFAGKSLTEYTFPDEAKVIGDGAFTNCKLKSINLRSDMSVLDNAFSGCTDLEEVNIPYGANCRGWNAFKYCTGDLNINTEYVGGTSDDCYGPFEQSDFSTIVLGPKVKYVVGLSCPNCIYCEATTPPQCVDNDFYRCLEIYVPESALNAYKTADGWKEFASNIRKTPTGN